VAAAAAAAAGVDRGYTRFGRQSVFTAECGVWRLSRGHTALSKA
jgi:hypothetical protein